MAYGIEALDRAARRSLERAGVLAVLVMAEPSSANHLMLLHGGIRCFCGQL